MENSAEHCDQREIKIHIDDASSNGDGYTVREASEVMLLAADSSKIGKYAQMLWYLNHINSTIALETSRKNNGELSVINITARDGGCVNEEEPVLVTTETLISYVVESYRFIFVIDISPSTFVVDGTAGCVPHSKIMCRLRQCLQGLVMDGNFLQKIKLSPKLFISICFYSPFIAFDEDRVILQGCLLTKKNINSVLNYVQERLSVFSSRLCYIVQRHLKRWNQNRMKVRKESSDSIPENFLCDSQTANDTRKMNFEADFADEGFMNSEWSLIFMLRIGFIGLQLLPDTAQPNIVVITDAVCHITDIHVLQKLMVQLWDYSVACSFVQIQDDCNTDAVFGHFSSPGFLVFLAKATSGVYIPDKVDAAILDVIDSRLFLCKHLQLPDTSDNHVKNLIRQINPEFLEPYTTGVVRRMHCSMEYESSLADLLRLRFYDGFVLRNLKIFKKEKDHSSLLLELCLPWKPQVTVGYKISAPFDSYMKRTRIKITVICEAQYGVMRDLLSDRSFVSSTKQAYSDAYRHTILGLLETDRMFIHLHSFTSMPDLYHVPLELPKGKSLFRYVMKEDKAVLTISTGELENLCLCNSAAAKFVEYWRIICEFENRLWQKWSQLYTFRIILTHDHPLPQGLFLRENSNAKVTSQIALSAFYNMLSKMATFTLVHGQAYVNFIESDDQNSLKSFYIIKTTVETQLVVIKLLFLDGLPLSVKKKVIEELQNNIMSLSVERSLFYTRTLEFAGVDDVCTTVSETTPLPALTIINRPLEIVLARYKQIPLVLNRIICLKIDEQSRDLVLHNSLAKYFSCRRFIWYLRKAFPLSSPVSCISADFILHTILQRRLNEGFHIAYFNDGIINLIKHVGDTGEQLHSSQAILQYVIFPLSVIRPLRVTKEELDRIPSLSKIFEMRSMQTNKAVLDDSFTLKNDVGLQLMTEMWSEPLAVSNPPSNALALEEQIRAIDEDIICSLSTLDQLMSLCTHHYSCSHFTLADCRDGVEFGKFERLSANLEVMQDCFYIRSLLKNATERELLLLPTLSYQSEDSPSNIRLCILLESLHRELAKVTHVTIEVRNPNFWLEIISGIHESVLRRPNAKDKRVLRTTDDESFCPTRIYVSRLSPWRAVITALLVNPQHVIMATSDVIATIPILVFHCDEPMIAHHLAHKEPRRCETYISDHRTKSPTSTLAHLNRQVRRTGNSTSNFFSKVYSMRQMKIH